jgi:hypothetical protein
LSKALDCNLDGFRDLNKESNQKLRDAFANPKFVYDPVLPKPDIIYEKEFHFLDETLNNKE